MKKTILVIGSSSKIAQSFINSVKDSYEVIATYHSDKSGQHKNVRYEKLDLSDISDIDNFVKNINDKLFFGVFIFASTYEKDVQSVLEYLKIAEKDLLVNAFSPIAICSRIKYQQGAKIFIFGDAGLDTPEKGFSSYSVSKSALTTVGKILAVELADRANVIIFKLGPTKSPVDCDDEKSYYALNLIHVDEPLKGLINYCNFLLTEKNLNVSGTEVYYDGGAYVKRWSNMPDDLK